jgi:hypothetical protein
MRMHDVIEESNVLKIFTVENMILSPKHWATCALPLTLAWDAMKFTPTNVNAVPDDFGGVYTFVVEPGIADHPRCSYLLYVGKAESQSFRQRYKQYLSYRGASKPRWPHVTNMLKKWDGYLWFCYARIDKKKLIRKVERTLQDAYIPPVNKQFWGKVGPARRAKL